MGISRKSRILDKLHRYTVNGIFVFSGCCFVFLGYRVYRFWSYTRPVIREKRSEVEQGLLSEGKPSEEDLTPA